MLALFRICAKLCGGIDYITAQLLNGLFHLIEFIYIRSREAYFAFSIHLRICFDTRCIGLDIIKLTSIAACDSH